MRQTRHIFERLRGRLSRNAAGRPIRASLRHKYASRRKFLGASLQLSGRDCSNDEGSRPYSEGLAGMLRLLGLHLLNSKLFIALKLDNLSIMNGYGQRTIAKTPKGLDDFAEHLYFRLGKMVPGFDNARHRQLLFP